MSPPGQPPTGQVPSSALPAPPARPEIRHPLVAYPGFDVMSQQNHWDEATRRLILDRVFNVPKIRFFTEDEARLLVAVADRIIPQDDRAPAERIPIVPWIDDSLYNHITNGYRYEDMPPQEEAWRLGLRGIDETARIRLGKGFRELTEAEQDEVLVAVATGKAEGETWQTMPAKRFWDAHLIGAICEQYYSHPTAWNEIGFGGPAYPRGYVALNHGLPDPWEVREVRLDATAGES
ncbi:MAG TPA: gluconate 2-dehydrogenase subunit 3 family protein [Chloroflexota bacterium]|nr:gluconate 2-dehydrogenase subunit 3 family protein [Chloroflexota bacterium]